MNLCSSCLCRAGLKVVQPQLLKVIEWCDGCKKDKKSYNLYKVAEQVLRDDEHYRGCHGSR